jgi:hypothetical protein
VVDVCYPDGTDWLCSYSQEELDEMQADPDVLRVMERAEALAWSTLSALLGYRLSLCPVLLRPCLTRCIGGTTWQEAPVHGSAFQPYVAGGRWYNACGCKTDCSCTSLCEVIMPTPVGGITEVWMDGGLLDPSAYRVDNGTRLVRTDGDCWPTCQDMTLDTDLGGAFTVSYYPHLAPNDLFRYAAGVLAAEYFKACSGKQCRLPQGVTSISRNGITMEIPSGLFPNGATGLREVDPIIRIYNPNGLKMPSRVMSPDSPRGRVQTWGH